MTAHRERPVDLPRFSVYAIELQDPRALGGPAQVYVGSTAKSPEERFARHLGGGPMANAKVRRYGARLRPDLTKRLGPYPTRDAAERAETRLRRRLEERGWRVFGGTGRKLFADWID
jgi:hypothetical protein